MNSDLAQRTRFLESNEKRPHAPLYRSVAENLLMQVISGTQHWRFRKKSDICVTLHPSSLRRRITTPHSSGFAGLDLRHFTKPSKFWLFTSSSKVRYMKSQSDFIRGWPGREDLNLRPSRPECQLWQIQENENIPQVFDFTNIFSWP